jgi:hypothetical protein
LPGGKTQQNIFTKKFKANISQYNHIIASPFEHIAQKRSVFLGCGFYLYPGTSGGAAPGLNPSWNLPKEKI